MLTPMKIKICSRTTVQKFITDLPHVVISVRDPGTDQVALPDNANRIAELYLDFSDLDGDRFNCVKEHELKPFTKDDAKSILTLLKLTHPYINLIVVNCEAGISRSSGIGAALSIILGMGDVQYFNPRGPYVPNRFVYRTILDVALEEGMVGGFNGTKS